MIEDKKKIIDYINYTKGYTFRDSDIENVIININTISIFTYYGYMHSINKLNFKNWLIEQRSLKLKSILGE